MREHAIATMAKPTRLDHRSLFNWFYNNKPIVWLARHQALGPATLRLRIRYGTHHDDEGETAQSLRCGSGL